MVPRGWRLYSSAMIFLILYWRQDENFLFPTISGHFPSFRLAGPSAAGNQRAPGLGLTQHSGIMLGMGYRAWQGGNVTALS